MLRKMELWVVIKSRKEEKNISKLQWNLIETHELPLGNQREGEMLFIMFFHPRK